MKSISNIALKYFNKFLGLLLALLGFSTACIEPGMEYGTPNADFIVKGKVISDATEQAIPSVRVIMNYDTSYSDSQGNYLAKINAFPTDQSFLIEFADIDGIQNGAFESLDTTVTFTDPQFNGGNDHWYYGETENELNIRMKIQD